MNRFFFCFFLSLFFFQIGSADLTIKELLFQGGYDTEESNFIPEEIKKSGQITELTNNLKKNSGFYEDGKKISIFNFLERYFQAHKNTEAGIIALEKMKKKS